MAPKRKNAELPLRSIWDEVLLSAVVSHPMHRVKIWNHLILSYTAGKIGEDYKARSHTVEEIPFHNWCVPKKQAQKVIEDFSLFTTTVSERSDSAKGDTTKLLVKLQDGHQVETVIMRHAGHATACISSQIGCQMGCRFCATGTMGIIGDLTSGEIIEQLVHANNITPIRNVVFMGMGEPLNNYDNVKRAVEFMVDTKRFALSPRHVTVSTVGVLKAMYRLSNELPYVNLALSLHAPNQDVRIGIVPAARAHPIEALIAAVDYHIECNKRTFVEGFNAVMESTTTAAAAPSSSSSVGNENTDTANTVASAGNAVREEVKAQRKLFHAKQRSGGKRPSKLTGVMIEYILIKDVNDKDEHAHQLGALLQPRRDHILLNLIPYNPTEVAEDYEPPEPHQVESFHNICVGEPYKIHTRVRQEKGQDIAGACGQLALVKTRLVEAQNPSTATTADLEDLPPGFGGSTTSPKKEAEQKAARVEQVLEGYQKSSMVSICNKTEAANIRDNSPVCENEVDVQQRKQVCGLLCFLNVLIPVALASATLIERLVTQKM